MQSVGALPEGYSSSPRLAEPPNGRELDEMVRLHAAELLARARVLTRQSSDAWDLFRIRSTKHVPDVDARLAYIRGPWNEWIGKRGRSELSGGRTAG